MLNGTLKSDIYLEQCIRKRLLPFLKSLGIDKLVELKLKFILKLKLTLKTIKKHSTLKITCVTCVSLKNYVFFRFFQAPSTTDMILFWPDLAKIHYAKIITDEFESKNVKFVSQDKNPPNLPTCRPIEQFWTICKREYGEKTKSTQNLEEFKRTLAAISKNVQKTMENLYFHHFKVI